MSSCDCLSARSAEGTLCSVKNFCTSSFISALQNFLVDSTISGPLDMVIFFSTSGQCAFTQSHAVFWLPELESTLDTRPAASWLRTSSDTANSSTFSTTLGSRNSASDPPTL